MLKLTNLSEWEIVEKVVKRHWIAFIPLFFYIIILIKFVIIVYYLVYSFTKIPLDLVHLFIIPILMLSLEWIYISRLNNELDMYVVTNKRIIWIDQVAFLNRSISECSIFDVQEVNSKNVGILWNIFNFGSLTIQTASAVSEFHMSLVPDPQHIARDILSIVDSIKWDKWEKSSST